MICGHLLTKGLPAESKVKGLKLTAFLPLDSLVRQTIFSIYMDEVDFIENNFHFIFIISALPRYSMKYQCWQGQLLWLVSSSTPDSQKKIRTRLQVCQKSDALSRPGIGRLHTGMQAGEAAGISRVQVLYLGQLQTSFLALITLWKNK